ncbi:MAG: GIY-YIG nuclease family protein [Candidatus Daviesbacteria bacterium]|nr:GIY-YIG nuclease family protein [Candidatus Daviesbacteria bacterium]
MTNIKKHTRMAAGFKSREEIIRELHECMEELGQTPSEESFYKYAKISKTVLQKNGWVHYGKLVEEQGLKPNVFDKTKYLDEQLCKMIIKLIRDLKKWPSRDEIDTRHYQDQSVPMSSTFYTRFNLAAGIAEAVLDYINGKSGYEDVILICKEAKRKFKRYIDEPDTNLVPGYVYLGFQNGQYKIGFATDPDRRIGQHSQYGPESMKTIHIIETDDARGIEAYWLNRFKDKSTGRPEWFKLTKSDIKAFKSMKFRK